MLPKNVSEERVQELRSRSKDVYVNIVVAN